MNYFITSGAQATPVFPLVFNSATAQTNTTHTVSITNGLWNETAKRLSLLSLGGLNVVGKFFEATGGLDINVKAAPIIVSNVPANIVVATTISIGGTTAQPNVSGIIQFGAFGPTDTVTLRRLNILTRAGADDTVTLVDLNGTALFALTVPAATPSVPLPFDLDGIPVPPGGFGVTTTAAGSVYQFLFDVEASTV